MLEIGQSNRFIQKKCQGPETPVSPQTSRLEYLSKSLFLMNTGSADTGYGYDGFESKVNISYTFSGFTEFLTVEFAGEFMVIMYRTFIYIYSVNAKLIINYF